MKTLTSELDQVQRLHLLNCYNYRELGGRRILPPTLDFQAAIYRIEQGNTEQAIAFIKSDQKTIATKSITGVMLFE